MLYDLPAPAKLNLFLHVVGQRADGYHLLQTVMRFIDLGDSLSFELRRDGQLTCENSLALAPRDDLVLRAARLLQQRSGTQLGAHIVCQKRIPAGAGLGGGSSDAATTLIALNRLWQTGLARADLLKMGAALGADVLVFIFGQTAFVEGIGERLTRVDVPDGAYVLVQPDAFVSTAAVFAAPDLTRNSETVKIADFADWQKTAGLGVAPFFGRNDLEPVVLAQYPAVRTAHGWLAAQDMQVRMTGSGSCLFVPHADLQQAQASQQQIAAKMAHCGVSSGSADDAPDACHGIHQIWACAGLPEHPLRHW